jgi:hypothetical protein
VGLLALHLELNVSCYLLKSLAEFAETVYGTLQIYYRITFITKVLTPEMGKASTLLFS